MLICNLFWTFLKNYMLRIVLVEGEFFQTRINRVIYFVQICHHKRTFSKESTIYKY